MAFSEHQTLRRLGQVLSRALLVTLFVLFAWANFSHWRSTGKPSARRRRARCAALRAAVAVADTTFSGVCSRSL